MKLSESQLRSVVRKIVQEQMEFEVGELSDIENDIENQMGVMGLNPSTETSVNLKNVMKAATVLGHTNLPQEFLMQMAENWTDLAHEMDY